MTDHLCEILKQTLADRVVAAVLLIFRCALVQVRNVLVELRRFVGLRPAAFLWFV